ncbi:MAG: UDP-2,3-diacylglucosamine diphosphatase, partial [Sphingomonas sp.]
MDGESIARVADMVSGSHGDIASFADFAHSVPAIPEKHVTERRKYRTIWISDVHLGTRGCNADMLIDFLDHVDSDVLYLVGDIIDGWRLKR